MQGIAKSGGIYLNPGDFRFYQPQAGRPPPPRLHTLLGSCVSIVLWHPERRLGGMSHIILPERSGKAAREAADGRYCAGAMALFRQEIARAGTMPPQYRAYLVGGGRMYSAAPGDEAANVGARNVAAARAQLLAAGFILRGEHVGQEGYRKLELDLQSGEVNVVFNNRAYCLSAI